MENASCLVSTVEDIERALPGLDRAIARAAEWLHRQDQASVLEETSERMDVQVGAMLRGESYERKRHVRQAERREVAGLVSDVASLLLGRRIPPRPPEQEPDPPFGKVLVAVGPGGIPDDVRAVSISALARELKVGEAMVTEALAIQAYALLTPGEFRHLVAWLRGEILEGRACLPYSTMADC